MKVIIAQYDQKSSVFGTTITNLKMVLIILHFLTKNIQKVEIQKKTELFSRLGASLSKSRPLFQLQVINRLLH